MVITDLMTPLTITGTVSPPAKDPMAPHDAALSWIGQVSVRWDDGCRTAAIRRVATGRGTGDPKWGQHVLVLHWLGDPPPAEVAQAVYDRIRDDGPTPRELRGSFVAQPLSETQPSYRTARA